MLDPVALGIAINLASTLITAGVRRVREKTLGEEQERALQEVFKWATAAMLVEIMRHNQPDRNLPDRLKEQFGRFFEDGRVAETVIGAALGSQGLPVDQLRRRYEELGL